MHHKHPIIFEQLSALYEILVRYRIQVLDDFLKSGFSNTFDPSVITGWFSNILGVLTNFSIGSFSVLFITFFSSEWQVVHLKWAHVMMNQTEDGHMQDGKAKTKRHETKNH